MTISPTSTKREAAPFRQILPLPRSPAITYVSNLAPLLLFTIATFSLGKISTASKIFESIVILPT